MKQEHQQIADFLSRYQLTPKDPESMIIKSHQGSYLAKNIQIDSNQIDIDNILETLEQHQTLNQSLMLTLINYTVSAVPNSTFHTVKTLYQYASLNLQEEIANRREANLHFKEEQLWAIVYSVTKALEYLQKLNIGYGVLGCDKIFIDKKIKLLDPSAVAEDPHTLVPNRLYSPEVIYQQDPIDILKSDVYVLGLCIIQAVLLVSLSSEAMPKYDETKIKVYLEQVEMLYGCDLSNLLRQMLEFAPEDRPTFSEIRDYLENTLQMEDQSDDCFHPLPPDTEDCQNVLELSDETSEMEVYDVQEEEPTSLAASLNEYEKAKLRFLSESQLCNSQQMSPIDDMSHSVLPQIISSNFELEKRKTSKSIKDKVVKNTNTLELEVMQVQDYRKLRNSSFNNSTSHSHLFTNPKLLDQIQKELKIIARNRNSHCSKENMGSYNY